MKIIIFLRLKEQYTLLGRSIFSLVCTQGDGRTHPVQLVHNIGTVISAKPFQNDTGFVAQLHEAYVKSLNESLASMSVSRD